MGMFTTVIDPVDGQDIQIYVGDDFCATYNVGDKVPWRINPHEVGDVSFLDGVYAGCRCSHSQPYVFEEKWVIVRDHQIIAVESFDQSIDRWDAEETLANRYGIHVLSDKELFTPKAIAEERERREQRDREFEEFFHTMPEGTSRLAAAMVWPISHTVNYQAVGRKLLMMQN